MKNILKIAIVVLILVVISVILFITGKRHDILIENNLGLAPKEVVGFENHGGRTFHNYKTLGKVIAGHGNNDEDGEEGMIYKNFIGTYLHGPFLPKNPHIADYLILNAMKNKYNVDSIEELNDEIEFKAHDVMVNRLK